MPGTLRVRHKVKLLTSRRWRVGLAALLPVSALMASLLTASPASADDYISAMLVASIPVTISQHACLDDWGGTQNLYNLVVAYPCDTGDRAQYWAYDFSNDTIHATDPNGGSLNSCLDVYAGETGDGTPVDLYPCNYTEAQDWEQIGTEFYNPQSNKCLNIPRYTVTPVGGPPTQLDISDCNGQWNQQFQFFHEVLLEQGITFTRPAILSP